jgi:hypothetical protein
MVDPDGALASWRSAILDEGPTLAAAAVRDHGALCVATRDDLRSAAGHVDARLTARWLSPTSLGATVIGERLVRSVVQTSRAKNRVDAAVAALGRSSEPIRAFEASGEISVEDAARLIRTLAATASAVESVLARSFIGFADEDARKQLRQALASYARVTGPLCTTLEWRLAATFQVAEVASKVYVRTHHGHRRRGNFDDVSHMAATPQSGSDLEPLSYLLDNRETLGRASATILAHEQLFASDVPAVAPSSPARTPARRSPLTERLRGRRGGQRPGAPRRYRSHAQLHGPRFALEHRAAL